jgi:2-polyprenyl-3-methyl-5-hydroxy-6-metoxy-1,4-benzoquinol methylase
MSQASATCRECGNISNIKFLPSPYWACDHCDLWFQSPMPPKLFEHEEEKGEDGRSNGHNQSPQDLEAAAHLARCFALNWIQKVPIKDQLPKFTGWHKTLDIGCKYPYFAHTLKKEFEMNAYGIDGMDFDDPNAEPIVNAYQQELGIPMLMVDFEKVTPDQILSHTSDKTRFDGISMIHVFEHMYEPESALKKIHELLNPEGYFLIRVPSHDVGGYEYHMAERQYQIHPYFYSEKSIRYLVEKTDLFEIVETYALGGGVRDFILTPKRN